MVDKQPCVFEIASGESLGRLKLIQTESSQILIKIAAVVAADPLWSEAVDAALVLKEAPEPCLAAIGYFTVPQVDRIRALQAQIRLASATFRYVGYAQAEKDCRALAAVLWDRFDESQLSRFCFTALPRGGQIILGMLSYILPLERNQLTQPVPPDSPLIVVDDCALSGVNFRRFLSHSSARRIIFCPLYSHPDLRDAILACEPRVTHCLSARDLFDHAPAMYEENYRNWRARWNARQDGFGYWVGQPEYLCFAWNEPDFAIADLRAAGVDSGWRIVPSELCLKNRDATREGPQLQRQYMGSGPLMPSPRTLFGDLGSSVVVADMETKICYVLEDVAADIWRATARWGRIDRITSEMRRAYDVDEKTLKTDLNDFIGEMASKGLIGVVPHH